jgi:hypothetical protein
MVRRPDGCVLAPPFATPDDALDRIAEILAAATKARCRPYGPAR